MLLGIHSEILLFLSLIKGTIKSCQRYLIRHNQVKLKKLFEITRDPGQFIDVLIIWLCQLLLFLQLREED